VLSQLWHQRVYERGTKARRLLHGSGTKSQRPLGLKVGHSLKWKRLLHLKPRGLLILMTTYVHSTERLTFLFVYGVP